MAEALITGLPFLKIGMVSLFFAIANKFSSELWHKVQFWHIGNPFEERYNLSTTCTENYKRKGFWIYE